MYGYGYKYSSDGGSKLAPCKTNLAYWSDSLNSNNILELRTNTLTGTELTDNEVLVLVVIGQSNAVGAFQPIGSGVGNLPVAYQGEQSMIKIWWEGDYQTFNINNGDFVNMHPNINTTSHEYTNPASAGYQIGNWSVEQSASHTIKDKINKTVYVINSSYGSLDLDNWESPSGVMWVELLRYITNATAKILALGKTPRFYTAFLQGESDIINSKTATYETRLTTFINNYRAINAYTAGTNFYIFSLSARLNLSSAGITAINTAYTNVAAALSNITIYDTKDAEFYDVYHYNETSLLLFGREWAKHIIRDCIEGGVDVAYKNNACVKLNGTAKYFTSANNIVMAQDADFRFNFYFDLSGVALGFETLININDLIYIFSSKSGTAQATLTYTDNTLVTAIASTSLPRTGLISGYVEKKGTKFIFSITGNAVKFITLTKQTKAVNGVLRVGGNANPLYFNGRVFEIEYVNNSKWKFCEGAGTVVYDSIGTNHLTATGAIDWTTKQDYINHTQQGFDLWVDNLTTPTTYLRVPFKSNGTSIKTNGDTISGFYWLRKYTQTGELLLLAENTVTLPIVGDVDISNIESDADYLKLLFARINQTGGVNTNLDRLLIYSSEPSEHCTLKTLKYCEYTLITDDSGNYLIDSNNRIIVS